MSIFSFVKEKIKSSYDSKKLESEEMARLRKDVDRQAKIEFEKNFKENYRKLAIEKAKRDALEKSGYARFKAEQEAIKLGSQSASPGTFFDKLRDYTIKNRMRTEENRKKNEALQKALLEERMKKQQMIAERNANRPFANRRLY